MAAMLGLLTNWQARAENENFSNKPPPALFNADCTGAGCHKGPQGLGKGQSQSGLTGFLREHYTNSRESAAALAGYLLKVPAGPAQPEPKPTRASTQRGGEREPRGGSWFDPQPSEPGDARPSRQQLEKEKERERTKPSRSAAKPPAEAKPAEPKPEAKPSEAKPTEAKPAEAKPAESEEPSPSAAATPEPAAEPEAKPESKPEAKPADRRRRTAEPAEKPEPKPAPTPRNQRGRQPAVAATPAPAAPSPAEHTPPPAPAAPPQYDIFD
jgi:hypothetical protein